MRNGSILVFQPSTCEPAMRHPPRPHHHEPTRAPRLRPPTAEAEAALQPNILLPAMRDTRLRTDPCSRRIQSVSGAMSLRVRGNGAPLLEISTGREPGCSRNEVNCAIPHGSPVILIGSASARPGRRRTGTTAQRSRRRLGRCNGSPQQTTQLPRARTVDLAARRAQTYIATVWTT